MTLSAREKKIVIVVLATLLLFLGDRYVVSPFMEARRNLERDIADAVQRQSDASNVMANSRRAEKRWKEITASGLNSDQGAADSQMLNAISAWARDAGLPAPAVKPDRMEQEKQFRKIVYHVATTGSMRSVMQFLWRIQTANIPARVTDLQLASRKEGADDLQMTVGISTLFIGPEPTPPAPVKPAASEGP